MTRQEYDWQPGGWQFVTKKSRILKTQEHYAWKRELNCFQGQHLPSSRCLSLRLRSCPRYCVHLSPRACCLSPSVCLSHCASLALSVSLSLCPSHCAMFRCAACLAFSAVPLSRSYSTSLTLPISGQHLPEATFGQNLLQLYHPASGTRIQFTALVSCALRALRIGR